MRRCVKQKQQSKPANQRRAWKPSFSSKAPNFNKIVSAIKNLGISSVMYQFSGIDDSSNVPFLNLFEITVSPEEMRDQLPLLAAFTKCFENQIFESKLESDTTLKILQNYRPMCDTNSNSGVSIEHPTPTTSQWLEVKPNKRKVSIPLVIPPADDGTLLMKQTPAKKIRKSQSNYTGSSQNKRIKTNNMMAQPLSSALVNSTIQLNQSVEQLKALVGAQFQTANLIQSQLNMNPFQLPYLHSSLNQMQKKSSKNTNQPMFQGYSLLQPLQRAHQTQLIKQFYFPGTN